jgi:hypothetical protein
MQVKWLKAKLASEVQVNCFCCNARFGLSQQLDLAIARSQTLCDNQIEVPAAVD